ncbi:hypothetical protein [Microbulbifer rhizosphaerae]|uniref:Uncharacterized protein n=1 Tax=Microbulbifer rhizosphaerae TaxID=1562603 RepID=A0A7W4ZA30_9GAMM|nr:hypothetical protein [Microbulbifer rhizosphaerae]MBB3062458.1 hypothetical protein [Microbulbifer rhizosphaerae]
MKSIRIYLLVALPSTITLVNFDSALHGYRASMEALAQNSPGLALGLIFKGFKQVLRSLYPHIRSFT